MNTQDTIRVGIIGAGTNTKATHIPKLQAIDAVELVSVCNRSRESGQRVADEFGIPVVCDSWEEILDDDSVDAVVIGTWPYMHKVLTCAALDAGKHVLCEARMAMNAEEAHEMWETSQFHPSQVAQIVPSPFTLRFDRTVQQLILDGYLGEILAVDLRQITGAFPNFGEPMTWRQDYDLSGQNTLTMGIWYEGLARWIGHASSVFASSRTVVNSRPHSDGQRMTAIRVPDHLDIIARMDCGAQARMQFSAVLGLARTTSEVALYGSEGTIVLDSGAGKLFGGRRGDEELKEIAIEPSLAGGWRVEEEFINAIRGEEEIKLTTLAEGVKYMEFTEAVAASAATGEVIPLPFD
ncbi:MAG: hypothetical protein DRQ37_00615 [Gammaproteobacteria bacterium]|nr:MAG: hypothetical protein DRQ37_00615 [Gammaproteobacteria bacterium]